MPLSTLVPFALVALIGIVVFYVVYRAGVWAGATEQSPKESAPAHHARNPSRNWRAAHRPRANQPV